MTDLFDTLAKIGTSTGGLVAAALVAIAALLPKLLNGMKADRIDASLLERLAAMDAKIHKTNVKVTRLVVLIIRLEALLLANGVKISSELQAEMAALVKEDEAE